MKRIDRIMQAWNAPNDDALRDAIDRLSENDMKAAIYALIKTLKNTAADFSMDIKK